MDHWKNAHDGHTEHCCCCIPANVGAHLLGGMLTASMIFNLIAGFGVIGVSFTAAIQPLVTAAIVAYTVFRFLRMVHHNDKDTREHYAFAYKVMVMIANALIIVVALVILGLSIWGWAKTGSTVVLTTGIGTVVGFVILIFLNVHFSRVVQTYASHDEHDHHHEGYEKHH